MKIQSKQKDRSVRSSSAREDKGLRRSLRLRLKASNTSFNVGSTRKLSKEKRGVILNNSFPIKNQSTKVRKTERNMSKNMLEKQAKQINVPYRGKIRNKGRASEKRKEQNKPKRSRAGKRKIQLATSRKQNRKSCNIAKGKSTIPKKKVRGQKAAATGNPKLTKLPFLEETAKMKVECLYSFSARHDYTKIETIRFCDVAFLDDKHIVALDDNFIREKFGHRICCFTLDGTLLCELPLPAHPWSVVVINPSEVVVSLRDTPSHGLIWLSVDVSSRSMEIKRHIPLTNECYGLAFRDDIFAVTYYHKKYISLLNTDAEEIGRIPVSGGAHYRCRFLDYGTLLYLNNYGNSIRCINLDGREMFSLEKRHCRSPIAVSEDKYGNIYVGNYGSGNVVRFTKAGKFVDDVCNTSKICGLAINHVSDLMAVAHEHFISMYRLLEEGNSE